MRFDDEIEVEVLPGLQLASCQMHAIEPLGYLRDLLCLLPSWPSAVVLLARICAGGGPS